MHVSAFKGLQGYLYLGSPYSKYETGIEGAFHDICVISADLIRLGVPVFSPIAHSHPIATAGKIDPLSHDIWLPVDEPLMRRADGMIIVGMKGWEASYGIQKEIEFFEENRKPIFFMDQTFNVRSHNKIASFLMDLHMKRADDRAA